MCRRSLDEEEDLLPPVVRLARELGQGPVRPGRLPLRLFIILELIAKARPVARSRLCVSLDTRMVSLSSCHGHLKGSECDLVRKTLGSAWCLFMHVMGI